MYRFTTIGFEKVNLSMTIVRYITLGQLCIVLYVIWAYSLLFYKPKASIPEAVQNYKR